MIRFFISSGFGMSILWTTSTILTTTVSELPKNRYRSLELVSLHKSESKFFPGLLQKCYNRASRGRCGKALVAKLLKIN
jgi:hypothetical protein